MSSNPTASGGAGGAPSFVLPFTAYECLRTLIIGLCLSAPIYGALVAQVLRYHANFSRQGDRSYFKVLVGSLTALNTVFLFLNLTVILQTVQTALAPGPFFFLPSSVALANHAALLLISVFTSAFFLFRAYQLYHTWHVPTIGAVLLAASVATNITLLVYQGLEIKDLTVMSKTNQWLIILSWINVCLEGYVAGILIFRLRQTGELKIRPQHDPLMQILGTALGTSGVLVPLALAGALLSTVKMSPAASLNGLIVVDVYAPLASLCVVYALNQRHELRRQVGATSENPSSWRGDSAGSQTNRISRISLKRSQDSRRTSDGVKVEQSTVVWDDDRILIDQDGRVLPLIV